MKIHPKHLIIGSIILFLLDFLILANDAIFPNHEPKGIATAIVLACALTFVVGIVWAIFKQIFKKEKPRVVITTTVPSVIVPTKNQFPLITLEIVLNRIFAFLLVLSSIPLLLNLLSLPTIIIFVVFAFYLWFGKKYHLVTNLLFFIIALGIYFVPIPPISWGFFRTLKELRLNNFNFNFPIIFLLPLLIFISFSVRNVLGNILAYFKTSTISRKVYFLITLIIVPATLLAYPLLDSFRLLNHTMNVNTAVGGDLPLVYTRQTLTFIDRYHMAGDFTSKFDSSSKEYIYHLRLQEPLGKDIQFTKVEADGTKINFTANSDIQCLNCQNNMSNPYGLVFPAGKGVDFIVTSKHFIKVIRFTEPEDKAADFVFWE